jgi:membrane-bound serine protease (ClpP class)
VKTLRLFFFVSLMAFGWSVLAQPNGSSAPHVDLIVIDGSINPAVDDFIRESINRAKSSEARALVIQLDTPGGLLSSTMAAHIASMAPATNIGAAHPVAGGGQEVKGVMGEKIENFTASFSETIAQKRGRNTEWAIEAVRRSVSITETDALKKKVIDIIAKDIDDLLRQADGRKVDLDGRMTTLSVKGVNVVRHEMSLKQRIVNAIADPNIAYMLLMAGILGLYMEFSNPGVLFPGITGAICLVMALISLQLLSFNYAGLFLILLGIALLVGEAFMPSFGILGIGGVISLALGSFLLFDTPNSDLTIDATIVYTAVATMAALVLAIGYLVFRSQKGKPTLGMDGLIGEIGEVRAKLNPSGKVFVHGEYWNAQTQTDGQVDVGEKVQIVGYDGMNLKVKRLQGQGFLA